MEAPIHYHEDDKQNLRTRLIAVGAGVAIIAVAVVVMINSGFWSPPASQAPAASVAATDSRG